MNWTRETLYSCKEARFLDIKIYVTSLPTAFTLLPMRTDSITVNHCFILKQRKLDVFCDFESVCSVHENRCGFGRKRLEEQERSLKNLYFNKFLLNMNPSDCEAIDLHSRIHTTQSPLRRIDETSRHRWFLFHFLWPSALGYPHPLH